MQWSLSWFARSLSPGQVYCIKVSTVNPLECSITCGEIATHSGCLIPYRSSLQLVDYWLLQLQTLYTGYNPWIRMWSRATADHAVWVGACMSYSRAAIYRAVQIVWGQPQVVHVNRFCTGCSPGGREPYNNDCTCVCVYSTSSYKDTQKHRNFNIKNIETFHKTPWESDVLFEATWNTMNHNKTKWDTDRHYSACLLVVRTDSKLLKRNELMSDCLIVLVY